MTLSDFATLTRIPTPGEFVAFAEALGWKFGERDGRPVMFADRGDPLAHALARMLSREPYRTNVLKFLADRARPSPTRPPLPEPVVVSATVAVCRGCKRPVDEKRRCWHCHDRACTFCANGTGSALVATCVSCGALVPDGETPGMEG